MKLFCLLQERLEHVLWTVLMEKLKDNHECELCIVSGAHVSVRTTFSPFNTSASIESDGSVHDRMSTCHVGRR